MADSHLRAILRRIALGLPLTVGPLVLVGGLAPGCSSQECERPSMSSRHPLTEELRARLGGAEPFAGERCRPACLELDGLAAPDGGMPGDAGVAMVDDAFARAAESVVCASDGASTLVCTYQGSVVCRTTGGCTYPGAVAGRAPSALLPSRGHAGAPSIGGWLAEVARLEAAAVPAFEELAGELAMHGAPRSLIARARRSARDERRHARLVGALASRAGSTPPAVERGEHAPRTLAALAADNAVEGCLREAYGALVAAHQAEHAGDAAVRAAFASIARDEARHALLSLDVAAWARARGGEAGARRARSAHDEAVEALWSETSIEPHAALRAALGLPDAERAVELARLVV